jgi:uncharacterized membrane protein
MPEYARHQDVEASAEVLFDYLSTIDNLPRYFAGMTSAKPGDEPGTIDTTAQVEGREVAGTARFEVDGGANRIEWSAEGPNDYRGWLEVTGDDGRSTVEVHIFTERESERNDIEDGLRETMASIQRLVEGGRATG